MDIAQFLLWFKESGLPQLASFVFSVAALVISLLSYRHTRNRDIEITTRSRKAELLADLSKSVDVGNQWILKINNMSDVPAKNVTVTLDDVPILKHESTADYCTHQAEVREIVGKDSVTYFLYLQTEYYTKSPGGISVISYDGMGTIDPPKEVRVSWTDDSGLPGLHFKPLRFERPPAEEKNNDL